MGPKPIPVAVVILPLVANTFLVAIILWDENHGMRGVYEAGLIPLALFGAVPLVSGLMMKYRWIAKLKLWWRRRKVRVIAPGSDKVHTKKKNR